VWARAAEGMAPVGLGLGRCGGSYCWAFWVGCLANRERGAAADPVTARFKADWPGFSTGPAGDVAVVDELAYVSLDDGGLLIVDVRRGSEPAVLGSIRFRGSGPVAVHGRWAFLGVAGLQVIDVSNPANPGLAAQYDLGSVRSLAVSGRHVYALSDTALTVLDAGNGSVPALVASVPQDGEGRKLVVSGERGCIAGGVTLQLYDLQDPTHPVKAGALSWEDGAPILDVAVSGAAAYVIDDTGLRVVDVSDAEAPRQMSSASFGEPLRGLRPSIAMSGAYAYIGSYGSLSVFDVSDLRAPGR